jgi:hypothetical protein
VYARGASGCAPPAQSTRDQRNTKATLAAEQRKLFVLRDHERLTAKLESGLVGREGVGPTNSKRAFPAAQGAVRFDRIGGHERRHEVARGPVVR